MSCADVTTICPMMRGGTPNPLSMRAMEIVAASVCAVSWPDLSDAPWTPIEASKLANFSVPAANTMKQADAHRDPAATMVGSLARRINATSAADRQLVAADDGGY
jgi:hypothetical protein